MRRVVVCLAVTPLFKCFGRAQVVRNEVIFQGWKPDIVGRFYTFFQHQPLPAEGVAGESGRVRPYSREVRKPSRHASSVLLEGCRDVLVTHPSF
jgi:hypothetical protein